MRQSLLTTPFVQPTTKKTNNPNEHGYIYQALFLLLPLFCFFFFSSVFHATHSLFFTLLFSFLLSSIEQLPFFLCTVYYSFRTTVHLHPNIISTFIYLHRRTHLHTFKHTLCTHPYLHSYSQTKSIKLEHKTRLNPQTHLYFRASQSTIRAHLPPHSYINHPTKQQQQHVLLFSSFAPPLPRTLSFLHSILLFTYAPIITCTHLAQAETRVHGLCTRRGDGP